MTLPVLVEGGSAVVSVQVANPLSADASLYGWIDFNGNGRFETAERATLTVAAGFTGGVQLDFGTVPNGVVPSTFSRFRLSTDAAAANPTGLAVDGEVEDHLVSIGDPERLGAIGNRVWLDENNDGRQDPGEPGIANASVELLDSTGTPLQTLSIDSDGGYLFPRLAAGDYQVRVQAASLPSGLIQTINPILAGGDFGNQSQVYAIALGAGEENLTADFGYNRNADDEVNGNTGTAALGDRVWLDGNGNGAQDPGEPGVPGVTLNLFSDPDGDGVFDTASGTTTTDAAGFYRFAGLASGAVQVSDGNGVLLGYWHSIGAGAGDGASDDNSQADPHPVVLTAAAPEYRLADFGYYVEPAALGNRVWNDMNGNGVQDGNDAGIAGVTVRLAISYPSGVAVNLATQTDATGHYTFGNLLLDEDYNGDGSGPEPGFVIAIVTPDGTTATLTDIGSGATPDRNDGDDHAGVTAQPVQGLTATALQPDPNQENPIAAYDFGIFTSPNVVNLGDLVWFDSNGNGQQDAGEPPLGGTQVTLLVADGSAAVTDFDGQTVAPQTTTVSGRYGFGNLLPADYVVRVTPPAGYTPTVSGGDPASDAATDSNGNTVAGQAYVQSLPVTLAVGGEPDTASDGDGRNGNLTVDFGFVVPAGQAVFDYGDLPDRYGLLVNGPGAAVHFVQPVDNPALGNPPDTENNGQVSDGANSDTFDDGVTIPPLGAGQPATFNVVVSNPGGGAVYINAWIDWNGDGDFDDPGEQIAQALLAADGDNAIVVTVPTAVSSGPIGMRVRLSSEPDLGPSGVAPDGEVEDYLLMIMNPFGVVATGRCAGGLSA